MPLSEHEQNLLDQVQRGGLNAEDPKFASTVRGARLRPSRRRRIQGISLFVLGVALLVVRDARATEGVRHPCGERCRIPDDVLGSCADPRLAAAGERHLGQGH